VALAGAHQRQNAALAVAAARTLIPQIGSEAIEMGLRRLRWPGRFEIVGERPPIVLDGAHNGASATALAQTLRAYAAGRGVSLVIGINRDKDARAVLRPLLPLAHRVWATQTSGNARALAADELARACRRLGATAVPEWDLRTALREAQASVDGVVCVTGSLMLVGQARDALGLPVPERLW
jgi:dihydrofolate synthase/folylpolyglutamate synthase